jgi:hypothetical protein
LRGHVGCLRPASRPADLGHSQHPRVGSAMAGPPAHPCAIVGGSRRRRSSTLSSGSASSPCTGPRAGQPRAVVYPPSWSASSPRCHRGRRAGLRRRWRPPSMRTGAGIPPWPPAALRQVLAGAQEACRRATNASLGERPCPIRPLIAQLPEVKRAVMGDLAGGFLNAVREQNGESVARSDGLPVQHDAAGRRATRARRSPREGPSRVEDRLDHASPPPVAVPPEPCSSAPATPRGPRASACVTACI